MNKRKNILLLLFLVLVLAIANYSWVNGFLIKSFSNFDKEDFNVKRIIDGDTIVVGNNLTVRLMGINCPERGEKYYAEAKEYLEDKILNKTVFVKFFGKDQYSRELGYVFMNDENVNVGIVERGLANIYLLDDRNYEKELRIAWNDCIASGINLCAPSKDVCGSCIILKELNVDKQKVVFENVCSRDCSLKDWIIKDEGRKKFIFPDFSINGGEEFEVVVAESGSNTNDKLFWIRKDYVWTSTGDTLFLRDAQNGLVLWKSY